MITLKIKKHFDDTVLHICEVNENEFVKMNEIYSLQIQLYKLKNIECRIEILYPVIEPEPE